MAVHDVAHEAAEAQAIVDRARRGQGRPALEHGAVLPATREEVVPAVDAVEAGSFQSAGGVQPPPGCHADRGDVDADAGPCALAHRAPRLLLPGPDHGAYRRETSHDQPESGRDRHLRRLGLLLLSSLPPRWS